MFPTVIVSLSLQPYYNKLRHSLTSYVGILVSTAYLDYDDDLFLSLTILATHQFLNTHF